MYAVGEGIVRSAGLPFDVLKPLLAETAAKALDAASPADVQTGPPCATTCPRWHATVHCSPPTPRLENIYSIISNNIWEISKKI